MGKEFNQKVRKIKITMRERIKDGILFTDYCEGQQEDRTKCKVNIAAFNASVQTDIWERMRLMKELFGRDTKAWIEPPFYCCYGYNIEIGEGSYVNFNCNFVDDGQIKIGKRVMFRPGVTIATEGNSINQNMREYMHTQPVVIGDNCWIGAHVTICPGVSIGENSVIGAGSVVIHDIPSNTVAAGNPCKVICKIDENDSKYNYKKLDITKQDLDEEKCFG